MVIKASLLCKNMVQKEWRGRFKPINSSSGQTPKSLIVNPLSMTVISIFTKKKEKSKLKEHQSGTANEVWRIHIQSLLSVHMVESK